MSSIPKVSSNFLSGVFSPLTSAEACEKSSRWLWKEKLCWYWCEKARKHICVTDRHDMTSAVKVALNPNTTNQPNASQSIWIIFYDKRVLNPFPNKPWSLHVYSASLLKTLWEIARYEQFLLFQLYFLPIWRTFCHIHQIWKCCLQTLPVWKSLELVVWERLLNASPRCIYTKEVIG